MSVNLSLFHIYIYFYVSIYLFKTFHNPFTLQVGRACERMAKRESDEEAREINKAVKAQRERERGWNSSSLTA